MMYNFGVLLACLSIIGFISAVKAAINKNYKECRENEQIFLLWLIAALICLK